MTSLDTLKESEVPGLDGDTLCAAVAQWCEGVRVENHDGVWVVFLTAPFGTYWSPLSHNIKYAYLTDGNAMVRLLVKYEIGVQLSLTGGWFAYPIGEAPSHSTNPHRAVAEAALMVKLRKQTK